MKYLVSVSDEKVFCDDESEAIALIEQNMRDGVSENDISVYEIAPVNFQVERVPVVKISDNHVAEAPVEAVVEAAVEVTTKVDDEPEIPDFRAQAFGSPAQAEQTESVNPFLSEQVFSLDS